jgi:hypothetical protein
LKNSWPRIIGQQTLEICLAYATFMVGKRRCHHTWPSRCFLPLFIFGGWCTLMCTSSKNKKSISFYFILLFVGTEKPIHLTLSTEVVSQHWYVTFWESVIFGTLVSGHCSSLVLTTRAFALISCHNPLLSHVW